MTESELNAKYTVAFVNSLQVEDGGRYTVSKSDADRLESLHTGKPIAVVKDNIWLELVEVVGNVLVVNKLEVE